MSLKKVITSIKRNKKFLITAHTNLEGDALGSELAMYNLLKKMGKEAVIVNEDDLPYEYGFLDVKNKINKFDRNVKKHKFDCLIVLDCSDLGRTGEVHRLNTGNKPVINIDHHISNQMFGDVNWVEPKACCCAEMVYKLYKKLGIPLDRESAVSLYTGLLTDTGSFHYPNTTSFAHKAVAELLKYKIDASKIFRNVYENIPFQDMKLLSRILPKIRRDAQGRIAWFQIERNMLMNRKITFDLSEHILGFARAIKDVEVVVLFKENLGVKNEVRINLRSQGKVDVNKIAQFFGGGGHKTASGATVKGTLDQVRKKVLAKIKESL